MANDPDGTATADEATGLPPAMEAGRLHRGQPGSVHQRHRGLLQRHQQVQGRRLRMPRGLARTRRISRTSGSSPCSRASTPSRPPSPGPSSSGPTWTPSATSATVSASRSGGRRPGRSRRPSPASPARGSSMPGMRPTRANRYSPALGLTGGGGFDVVTDVIKRTANLDDPASIVDAIKATDLADHLRPHQVRRPARQLRHQPAGRRPVDRQGRRLGTVRSWTTRTIPPSRRPAISWTGPRSLAD